MRKINGEDFNNIIRYTCGCKGYWFNRRGTGYRVAMQPCQEHKGKFNDEIKEESK